MGQSAGHMPESSGQDLSPPSTRGVWGVETVCAR